MSDVLLSVEDLRVDYRRRGWRAPSFTAVDGVSFAVGAGQSIGLVGESGSGKSTIGRAVLGLTPVTRGSVVLDGEDVTVRDGRDRDRPAGEVQVVFQDPYGSLNPSRTIGRTLTEPLEILGQSPAQALARVQSLLAEVRMPTDAVGRYPHAFSGGQRQRIAIARALAGSPRLIVCDEAVSALDLVTQAQVLNLLRGLQREHGLAYLFIAHNLAVVAHMTDHVLVLYRGRIMERGTATEVCDAPLHPYTRALVDAAPVADPDVQRARRERRARSLRADATNAQPPPPDGCPFAPRCAFAAEVCWSRRPTDVQVGQRTLACHAYDAASGHPSAGAGIASVSPPSPNPQEHPA
jgi:oligopeptide/dipeptide ABC transporter ATP-binding protein